MSKPTLGYWNIRGMGQATRFLLKYLEVDFEEKRYSMSLPSMTSDEWLKDKNSLGLKFPDLPYWIDGGTKLTQSLVILKEISRKYGPQLIPTEDQRVECDMLVGYVSDVQSRMGITCYFYNELADTTFVSMQTGKLAHLSQFLGDNPWCLGNQLTYVDFLLYETLYRIRLFKPKMIQQVENLGAFIQRFEQLPAIAAYLKSPQYIDKPIYLPFAKLNP